MNFSWKSFFQTSYFGFQLFSKIYITTHLTVPIVDDAPLVVEGVVDEGGGGEHEARGAPPRQQGGEA